MNGLRFCFLTTFYPPYHFGGDAIAVQRLARGLVRAGHQVTVVHDCDAYHALHPALPGDACEEPTGLEVVGLRSRLGSLAPLLTQQLGRPVINGRRIARLLEAGGFDVINYHNVSLIGGPGLLAYGKALKLYMAHEHWLVCPTHVLWRHQRELCTERQCFRCQLAYRRPPQLWRWTGLLRRQLAHVDGFIAMSAFSREKHREFGFPRDMDVLPPFLPDSAPAGDDTPARRPQDRPYFLVAGRLERIKGFQDVIPLFAGSGDADLLIAGEGAFGPELRAQAAGMQRVRFLGRVAAEALTPLYRHAVALIMPSLCYETFGITVLEAFRQATPVVARRLGPLPDIVDCSGGGELFSTREELKASLARL
ncbi:MAG TPA: glycosyltransferase family 4 protein, partial [Gemmatimonadales bacterium]|nr:glycosyltransferase family 4 protein [Gemmatimonadales bacterium]